MKAKKIVSVFLALFLLLGAWGDFAPVTVLAANSGNTGWQANAAKAGAGPDVLETVFENHYDDIHTRPYELCGGSSHMQGVAVDEEMKYMFFSYTTALAVIEIATGELVASINGFGNAHIGCIDYFDGYIYASMEYKSPGKKFYLAIFDVERLLKAGVGVSAQTQKDAAEPILTTVLLAEPTRDFRAPIDTTLFTGQDQYGQATDEVNNGHWFACSGIDGVTMGKWPGGTDDELYMIVAYGVYQFIDTTRNDNTYNILQYYKLSDIWNENGTPTAKNKAFDSVAATSTDWAVDEQNWLTAGKTLYVYTGNTVYGAQNIEFEWDSGDLMLYTRDNTDMGNATDATNKGYKRQRNYYEIDGSVEPALKTLYLGQHSTDEWAKKVAKAYANYPGAQVDENGYMKGYVGALKCICGDKSSHDADVSWPTGVHYSEAMICSNYFGASPHQGLVWIGSDPNDENIDYFYVQMDNKYSVRLFKRYYLNKPSTRNVGFDRKAWTHIAETENGTVTCDKTECVKNATATLTVTPDPYYCLKSLTVADVDGSAIAVDTTNYTFKMGVKPINIAATFERIADITGYEAGTKSAKVTFKEAEECWVVFADYGENKTLQNIDLVKHSFTAGENTVPQEQTGFALGTGDKVMLWGDMTSAIPVCPSYIIE